MIIKANPNKDINPNKINNYKIIYQKIKEEIKSVVITKLLNQVQTLSNNYQKLLKENSLIKNDLIYILKRILLNKKDYINITNNSNSNKNYQIKSLYSMPYFSNSSFLNCKSSILDSFIESIYIYLWHSSTVLNSYLSILSSLENLLVYLFASSTYRLY